jgi:hypothetical protein
MQNKTCAKRPLAISDVTHTAIDEPGSVQYSGPGRPRAGQGSGCASRRKRGKDRPGTGYGDPEEILDRQARRDPLCDPPGWLDPQPGDVEPTGRQCPVCGALNEWWVYNPFTRTFADRGGWGKMPGGCHCTKEAEAERERQLRAFERGAGSFTTRPEQLDRLFGHHPRFKRTFENFLIGPQPKLKAMRDQVKELAASLKEQVPERGLFLVGPPSIGKKHLLSALVSVALHFDVPALLMGAAPRPDCDTREHHEALAQVPLLCLTDLLLHPLLPSELRRLDALLETRERAGLLTCFSAHAAPQVLALRAGQNKDAAAVLLRRALSLADLLLAPGGVQPFTPHMEKATR